MMNTFGETNFGARGARSLWTPWKIVHEVAGKSWALIFMSTAILRAYWSCASAPESLHAGMDFHLGSFSGRPRVIEDSTNFALEALANLWNLLIFPMHKVWLHFGALPGIGWGCPKPGGGHPGKIRVDIIVTLKSAEVSTLPWFLSWGGKGFAIPKAPPPSPPELVLTKSGFRH